MIDSYNMNPTYAELVDNGRPESVLVKDWGEHLLRRLVFEKTGKDVVLVPLDGKAGWAVLDRGKGIEIPWNFFSKPNSEREAFTLAMIEQL